MNALMTSAILIRQVELTNSLWLVEFLVEQSRGFLAGQYQSFYTETGDAFGPFSIASTPDQLPIMRFCTRHQLSLSLNTKVFFNPTKGHLVAADNTKHYILCAGGTGITPFLSLLKSENKRSFSCYWSLKNIDDQCLLELFEIKNVTKHYYNDNDHYDLQPYLIKHLQESNCIFYLAGPFVFVDKLGDWLIQQGISPSNIFSDMKKFI
ncbi:hypothetical protein EBR43_06750 [bacterium]|nr:hypothetical protein [bacterium]NBW57467.1 hypothetical protein [bacterium]NBX72449.1 hypothetical protein [bacterium]